MKNIILCFFLFLPLSVIFPEDYSHSQDYVKEVPELLQGIWQGSDRLILFSPSGSDFTCILRVFYQWYDDEAAVNEEYSQISTRGRNNTTARHPENIDLSFKTLFVNEDKTAGAFEVRIKYPSLKEYVYVPVAVIDSSLYLNFYIKKQFPSEDEETQEKSSRRYYLLDYGTASGLMISPPVIKKELLCYYVDGPSVYHIRYWLSGMEETDEEAEFLDGNDFYKVPKYIQNSGNLYTCTTGRSHRIRNIQKSSSLSFTPVTDSSQMIYARDTPYLVYVPDSGLHEKLYQKVKENNLRRHPPLKPPFPPSHIDFHWKEISDLEKYNPYTWNRRNIDIHK